MNMYSMYKSSKSYMTPYSCFSGVTCTHSNCTSTVTCFAASSTKTHQTIFQDLLDMTRFSRATKYNY